MADGVSVLLPVFDGARHLPQALDSLRRQTFTRFEIMAVDDGSTDATPDILTSFGDDRIQIHRQAHAGLIAGLNDGLAMARAPLVARMDADDLSFPDRFKEQMEVINQRPDLVLIGTQRAYLTPFGHIFEPAGKISSKEIGRLSLRSDGSDRKFFVDASVIFRRRVALEVGGYDPEFQMGDVPLWFRMLSYGKGWEIAKPLYLYRLHPSSLSYAEFAASDQSYRFLVKYAPQLLPLYYSEDSAQHPKSDPLHIERYWLRIAAYEALTGDREIVLEAVDFFKRDGAFKKEARLITWFSYLGRLGSIFYGWHRRNKYRHRPDLEKFFTALVGPLALDRRLYAG